MPANATSLEHAVSITPDDVFDLEAAYVEWVETEARDPRSGVFHPSAVGMCKRRNVYEYICTPTKGGAQVADKEIFRLGHGVHGIVQGIIGDLERVLTPKGITYEFYPELPYDPQTDVLYHDFGIGGTTDGLLILNGDGWSQRGILEVKSIGDDGFNKLTAPKKDHLMQANLYAFRFNAPVLWFWYYNKNNSQRRVYRTLADDNILNEAIERFADMRAHADAGTLPDREESYYMCPRCEYAWTCEPSTLRHVQRQEKLVQVSTRGGFGARRK